MQGRQDRLVENGVDGCDIFHVGPLAIGIGTGHDAVMVHRQHPIGDCPDESDMVIRWSA